MELLQLLLFILLCSVALGWVARHFQFPYPIALVIGGGVLGFVPKLPELPFNPELILVLVLPPILYQAALLTSWRDFKANLRPIGLLAIGLVIATTLAVGATLKLLVPDIPWAAAFVLGAIVSPPDAVAATAILSRLSIPRRVVTILEGESLVNDASGLVIYKFAVAAVLTGAFSLADASVQFVWLSLGGIGVGIALSFVFIAIHKRLGDTMIEVLTTLIVPYVAYIAAESMHVSGVLAVVAAGLIRGRYSPAIVSAEMRIIARSVWNMFVFLLNSLVFMLIGLQLSGILGRLGTSSVKDLAFYSLLVCTVAIAVRFLWIHPAAWLSRALAGGDAKSTSDKASAHIPERELVIMSWCGMRGIVSLAAALALPVTLPGGEPFPYRDLIIFLTFVVIAITLVMQGLTLSPLIRFLNVGHDWSAHDEHQIARAALGTAAATAIDKEALEAGADADVIARIRAEFADKIVQTTLDPNAPDDSAILDPGAAIARRLRRAAISAERRELLRIWRDNLVSDEVLHHIEEELDYQESHI
ncbi:MAG: Na+/H+ antiporter [Betaproteobacteria bacterium]